MGNKNKIPQRIRRLQLALGMAGVATNPMFCEIVLNTQAALNKMGKDFDLKTACNIRAKAEEKYSPKDEK